MGETARRRDGPLPADDFEGRTPVILLTRLNGPEFALNPDLIERADQTPDTVITLVDGTKYIIAESLSEFLGLVRRYRAELIADAEILVSSGTHRLPSTGSADSDQARVVRLHRQER